jgi:hypothetical protein
MLMVVAFWFEVALARRAFVLRTIERPWRLMRTGTACIARRRGLFGTLLRLVSVFLAIRTLLARAFVLGMIRLARIAESALTRIMTVCTALGDTRFGLAFVFRPCPDATHTVQYFGQFW